MLDKHGYTQRCLRCRAISQGMAPGTVPHSEECRRAIMEKLSTDPEYQDKVREAEDRKNQFFADELSAGEPQAQGHG